MRLITFFLIIAFNQAFAQNELTVLYKDVQKTFDIERYRTLKIKGTSILYEHHQVYESKETPQGYTRETSHDFYNWYFDGLSNEVIDQKILEDNTPIIAYYKPDPFEWQLINEEKTILGYRCQKAILDAKFATQLGWINVGDMEVWFTSEIPVSAGPEKLWGLPGLIMEIGFTEYSGKIFAYKIIKEPVGDIVPKAGLVVTKNEIENPNKISRKKLKDYKKL
jgi:GLPGLI family protein